MKNANGTGLKQCNAAPPNNKRAYVPPTLILFGRVAALTLASSNCTDDNAICQPPVSNMGPTTMK